MPRYRLSKKAQDDIAAIAQYTAETFGIDQALSYRDGLIQTFDFLADFPMVARERHELGRPTRVYRYESHMIFYRLDGDGIFIQRVRHGKEDWINQSAK